MSPATSTTKETTNVSPRIFDLAIDRYGFDYPLWADNSGVDVDGHGQGHFDNDEGDEDNRENTPTARDHDDDDNQPQCHRRTNRVLFHRIENITDSVIRSLFQKFSSYFFSQSYKFTHLT